MFVGDRVEAMPFEPLDSAKRWLCRQMVLAYTGISHSSGDIHNGVWKRYDEGDEVVLNSLLTIRKAARKVAEGFGKDRRDEVVFGVRDVTAAIEAMAPELNAPYREVLDPLMANKSAMAWKGMGAAGGGCVGIFANQGKVDEVKAACQAAGWKILEWEIDEIGLQRGNYRVLIIQMALSRCSIKLANQALKSSRDKPEGALEINSGQRFSDCFGRTCSPANSGLSKKARII